MSEVAERGRPILIAHSMGGWLGQMLLSGPEAADARGAVLITPVPASGLPITTSLKVALQHPLKFLRAALMQSFSVDTPDMARKFFHGPGKSDREVVEATAKLRPESALACIDMIFGLSRVSPKKIGGTPLLLLSAEHDYFFPPPCVARNAKQLGAEYMEFPSMAHNLLEGERWEEVAAAILAWIGRLHGRAVA